MKRIKLTQGKYAIVDDEDFERLNYYNWSLGKTGNTKKEYAKISIKRKTIKMHRLIMNTPQGMDTDHINGNGLDNRKSNLRICTQSQNEANKGLQKNNTSGFKGVQWNKQYKKWSAKINKNKKSFYVGYFTDKKEAAKAYNTKAKELFGEFARLNVFDAISVF